MPRESVTWTEPPSKDLGFSVALGQTTSSQRPYRGLFASGAQNAEQSLIATGSVGGGYDPSMRTEDGHGAAGPAPGSPSGSVLNFGRYSGWSLGEIGRADLEYIEWLDRMPIGRPYREEIDAILRRIGRRRSAAAESTDRRGLFRRR